MERQQAEMSRVEDLAVEPPEAGTLSAEDLEAVAGGLCQDQAVIF
ncbi:MAG: hypothetical protein RIB84_21720 [Sneathiellaceae bacterium]